MKIQGEFTVGKWDEKKIGGSVEKPIASVSATFNVSGGMNGKLNVEYLMCYSNIDKDNPHNSKAMYTGYMLFNGTISGKPCSFAAEDRGAYTALGPKSGLAIIPGSGAGDFAGVSGKGGYGFKDGKMIIEFDLK